MTSSAKRARAILVAAGIVWTVLLALVPCTSLGEDESSPVMLSLLSPVEWPSPQSDVGGFRLSLLYGECRDFAGLDKDVVIVGNRTHLELWSVDAWNEEQSVINNEEVTQELIDLGF